MKKFLVMVVGILSMVGVAFAGDVKTDTKVIKAPAPIQKQVSTVKKATKKTKKVVAKKVEAPKTEIKK